MCKKFPRYDSLTNKGMFEGYCIDGGMYYASSEQSLLCILRQEYGANYMDDDQTILDHYYLSELYEWTSWEDIPDDEWDCPPKKGMTEIQMNVMLTLMSRSKFLSSKYNMKVGEQSCKMSLGIRCDESELDAHREEFAGKMWKVDSMFMKIFDSLQQ